jgi:FkbM family methyltransferase
MALNFSGIDNRSPLGSLIRLPLRLIPKGMVLPILQGPLKGKRWIAASSNHGCWLGSYELHKQLQVARAIVPGMTVYDIGANVGFYSLLASVLVGPSGKVHAFEPVPRNFDILRQHLRINGAQNVVANRLAIASSSGFRSFSTGGDYCMGHLADHGQFQVQTSTLDSYIGDTEPQPPAIVKIDVEGAEVEVLEGAHQFLLKRHPIVFLATHGQVAHRECCRLLESAGYSLKSLDARPVDLTDELVALPRRALTIMAETGRKTTHLCFDA